MGFKKDLEINLTISEREYQDLENIYKKHGLGSTLKGWRPSGDLMVVKKIVETIRTGGGR